MKTNEEMYLAFVEEDIKHIKELEADMKKWQEIYKKEIFSIPFPIYISNIIKAIKKDILDTIDGIKSNIEKAKELRRLDDEAYQRQLKENRRNVDEQGEVARDSVDISTRAES